jgi:dTDP-4-dehydrorhamnose reductase
MTIAVSGSNGFIGGKITPLLQRKHKIIPLLKEEGFDITNQDVVMDSISQSNCEIILHLAAYTNVDEAEKQKIYGQDSEVWKTNVQGSANIAQAAKKFDKKLIYISTDMVFGKNEQNFYHEKDNPSPVNFYGETKLEGEKLIKNILPDATILRIAYPYTFSAEKGDYVRLFIRLLKERKPFSSVADCYYTPTYIDDIATVINIIIERNLTGVIHGTSGEKLSGFEIAQKIAEKLGFDKNLVSPTTRAEFFKDRAPRAKNTALFNDTLNRVGIQLHTLEEALDEIPQELLA